MVRFFQPPPWRHVVTNLDTETLTLLDRLAIGATVDYDLNTPSVMRCRVPSSNPEINIVSILGGGDPFVAEGARLCYSFRKDGSGKGGTAPWGVRHSGIILVVEDEGDDTTAYSPIEVWDPWAYLYTRPCVDSSGDEPGSGGLKFFSTKVADIALALLENTINAHGTTRIDAGTAWGGTSFYDGFLASDTEAIDYNVQRGKTVGEAWEDLCATELMDLELVPIYDPFDRPGYLSELNIYRQPGLIEQPRGEERPAAIFSWDRPPKTLSRITRRLDGRARANKIQFYNRFGVPAGLKTDASSVTKYGQYLYEQQFPDQADSDRVGEWAQAQLAIRSRGGREVIPLPSAQQPPFLFDEYFVGDRVPVYATDRLRETIPDADAPNAYHRVIGLSLGLDPEETLTEVRVLAEPDLS
jgi:hypothetical protein